MPDRATWEDLASGGADAGLALPAPTCQAYSILDICEQAHRDARRGTLCLPDEEVDTEEVHRHLKVCPLCARLYRNAYRAYEGLGVEEPGQEPYQPIARRPEPIPAAEGPHCQVQLKPAPAGQGLDALTVLLEWERESGRHSPSGEPRWWLTLKLLSVHVDPERGSDEAALRCFDGRLLRLNLQVAGGEPIQTLTRFGFDADRNLVSVPRSLPGAVPGKAEWVTLVPLEEGQGEAER
jgi:hypothetical protein